MQHRLAGYFSHWLLATLVCLALAGCGDSKPKAKQVVKVGVLHSQTGTMADSEKPVLDATLLAIEEINKREIIPGVRIEPVVEDGASNPETFARLAEQLITEDEVAVIFGGWTSASRKAIKPVVEKYNNLLFYPVQYEGIEQSPNIVYLGAAPNQQIIPAISWAIRTLGAKKFFLVGSDYVFPHTANTIIKDQLKAFKLEAVGEAYIPLGSSDVQDAVMQIVDAKPDIIINTINGSTNKAFFQALRDAGVTPEKIPTLSFSIGENELKKIGYRNMIGDYAAWNYFESLSTPENQAWVETFKKRYGDDRTTSDPMEAAYLGVYLWAQAARDANSDKNTLLDSPNCEAVMLSDFLPHQSLKGPGGLVFIHPDNQHLYKIARIGQIESGGQFRIVWSSDVAVRPQPFPIFRSEEAWMKYLAELNRNWGGAWTAPTKE